METIKTMKTMKYIKTKDGIYELMPNIGQDHTMSFDGETLEPAYYSINHEWIAKKDVIKKANTIKELFDEFLVFYDYERVKSNYRLYWTLDEARIAFNRRKEKGKKDLSKLHLYGAIWAIDSNGVPTLKPVAKMKGVLPNGEIDWELL